MAGASDYLENEILDHVLGTGSFAAPSAVYLALFSDNPTDAGTGTELSGNGYARQETAFDAASNGAASNSGNEVFSASGGDLTASHFGIFDASSGGNLLLHGQLSATLTITDGNSHTFAPGDVTVTVA
jgi:hypothetical protein